MVADKGQICALSGVRIPRSRLVPYELVSGPASEHIRKEHPNLKSDALIDRDIVNRYRREYVEELLRQERGELTDLDHQVAQSLASGVLISEQLDSQINKGIWRFASDAWHIRRQLDVPDIVRGLHGLLDYPECEGSERI